MAYKLQVTNAKLGINFHCRYENLTQKETKAQVVAKNVNGDAVRERQCYQGQPCQEGDITRVYMDEAGNQFSKEDLTFWEGNERRQEVQQTKVLEIEGFSPLSYYNDKYIISAYYEIFPADNDQKRPDAKEAAMQANLIQMYKLWKYLHDNGLVARGEFCPSSRGFTWSDGYIRPVLIGENQWGLEIGVFKEQKNFKYLTDGEPQGADVPDPISKRSGSVVTKHKNI